MSRATPLGREHGDGSGWQLCPKSTHSSSCSDLTVDSTKVTALFLVTKPVPVFGSQIHCISSAGPPCCLTAQHYYSSKVALLCPRVFLRTGNLPVTPTPWSWASFYLGLSAALSALCLLWAQPNLSAHALPRASSPTLPLRLAWPRDCRVEAVG